MKKLIGGFALAILFLVPWRSAHAGATTVSTPTVSLLDCFHPKSYGAYGDGKHDDWVGISSANFFAQKRPSGTVCFDDGSYRVTRPLFISSGVVWVGLGALTESNDSDYFNKSGAPNEKSGPSTMIYFDTANVACLTIQNKPTSTFKMMVKIRDIMFAGPGQSSGTAGHGIVIDSNDTNYSALCRFTNVAISNFGGHGLWAKQGYYGSSFEHMGYWYNGMNGFRSEGTSQGEWVGNDWRLFGNGTYGTTEDQKAPMYVHSGSGISFNRISASPYQVGSFFDGVGFTMSVYHSEAVSSHTVTSSNLIIKGCSQAAIFGADFTPNGNFLGKSIDIRSQHGANLQGLAFYSAYSTTTGYAIYEDTNSTANIYHWGSQAANFRVNMDSYSIAGANTEMFKTDWLRGTTPPAGWKGQLVSTNIVTASAISSPGTGQYFDICSVYLETGSWTIMGQLNLVNNSATTSFSVVALSQTSGNSSTGITLGVNGSEGPPSNSAYNAELPVKWILDTPVSTRVYLKGQYGISAGSPKAFGSIDAVRR